MKHHYLILLFSLISCTQTPFTEGTSQDKVKVNWAAVGAISENSAILTWECSSKSLGFVNLTGSQTNRFDTSFFETTLHAVPVHGLNDNELYRMIPSCGSSESGIGFPIEFRTSASLETLYKRGFWIVGGTGSDNSPVSQIDFYDPVNDQWISGITNIPTPRINAQIVSHLGKIYIMGGITKVSNVYTVSRRVEVFDPLAGSWETLADMPNTLQGGLAASIGDEIYVIAGTTSLDMTTGTVLNTIYRFLPKVGVSGVWSNYTSSTSIFGRVDMSSCDYNGSIFMTGGRFYQDGLAYGTSDAYIPSLNSTTGKIEASISIARHSAGAACYRPKSDDIYNSDPPIFLIAGGSTSTNLNQPVTSITASNRFEFMGLIGQTNSFTTGSNLPEALYGPSMEIDYTSRKVYLFGGATSINLPGTKVRTLDLTNITGNPWVESSSSMPRARFGHKVVILSR